MSNIDICLNCFNSKKGFDVCPSCGWYDGAEPENAYHLYPGSILRNRYLVGMSVGFGGFGITYKAWDNKLGTIVAIKEFYPSGLVNRVPHEKNVVVYSGERENQFHEQKQRFLDEARTMSKFTNHPNIVHVFDFFEENNTAYIVMEYLDGISAKKYLEQCGGKLDQRSAVDIMIPVLDALTAIHSKKIVHRDISPDNIFLTLDNKIKLIDLGAARLTNSEKEETISVVIKPGYAPPEQYHSKSKQGPWTDIYGVGATLYKFLTGTTPDESIDRRVKDTLKKPSVLDTPVDSSLDRIVMKSMAIKPELRFQTAQQMKNALVQQKEVDFPEDELRKRKILRNVLIATVSVLSVVLVTSVTLFMTVFRPQATLANVDIAEGTISVLLPQENKDAFNDIIEQFETQNDDKYKIEPEYVAADEVTTKLSEKQYSLMVTDGVDEAFTKENLLPLDMLVRSVEENNYVFAKQYEKIYPAQLEMPLGFDVLIAYANTSAAKNANVKLPAEITSSGKPSSFSTSFVVKKDNYTQFLRMYDENVVVAEEFSDKSKEIISDIKGIYSGIGYKNGEFPAEEAPAETEEAPAEGEETKPSEPVPVFLQGLQNGKCIILLADTSIYNKVQSNLAGYYKLIPVKSASGLTGQYNMHLGINKNITENEQYIAQLFLAHCLSDVAQNVLHVQHRGSLPVHILTLNTYSNINTELQFINTLPRNLSGENRRFYILNNEKAEKLCFE